MDGTGTSRFAARGVAARFISRETYAFDGSDVGAAVDYDQYVMQSGNRLSKYIRKRAVT